MRRLLAIFVMGASLPALGQEPAAATAAPSLAPAPLPWYRPRYLVLQTAGGVGLAAGGVGYTMLRDKAEADILVGYVPKKYAGSTLFIATAKLLYTPYTVRLSERLQLRPLTVGVYVSYTHGTINDEDRGQYTKGYYWFSTDTRVGPLLGGRLTYRRSAASRPDRQRRISAYYELGSNDLYLVSYFASNNALSPADILVLGVGLKMDF